MITETQCLVYAAECERLSNEARHFGPTRDSLASDGGGKGAVRGGTTLS